MTHDQDNRTPNIFDLCVFHFKVNVIIDLYSILFQGYSLEKFIGAPEEPPSKKMKVK